MSADHHSSAGSVLLGAVIGYLAPFGGHAQLEDFVWRIASAVASALLIGAGNWLARRLLRKGKP